MWRSVLLSATSAVVGAVFGAFLAYLIVTQPATSAFRRVVTAVSGVLAQVGGGPPAFAVLAPLRAPRSIPPAGGQAIRPAILRFRVLSRRAGLVLVYSLL